MYRLCIGYASVMYRLRYGRDMVEIRIGCVEYIYKKV